MLRLFLMNSEIYSSHLTQHDYEYSLVLNQLYENKEEQREFFQNEPKKKYDLRPRAVGVKSNPQTHNKKENVPAKQGPIKDTGK
jgi:hypothetical protein